MALEKIAKIPSLVRKAGQTASKAQPFYSPVDEAIARITQGKGTGAQMLAELLKTKGVAKELKDRPAIKKTLEANKDAKVTKADLERVAAENPAPQVQEKSPSPPFDENNPLLPSNNSLVLGPNPHYPHGRPDLPIGVFERETGELITAGQTERDAILDAFSEMPGFWNGAAETTSAFRKYTIPGGENYREILLRLPVEKASAKDQQRLLEIQERIRELSPIILKQPVGDTAERKEFHDLTHEKLRINRLIKGEEGYNSPHFEEPNVLAHARVTDRVGPNGEKILHVEEIQSDWHQAGRKKGYRGEEAKNAEREFKSYAEDLASKYGLNPEQNLAMYATMKRMQPDEVAKYEELQSAWANSKGGVPDAPFKQNWHELVMKRLLDDAARNGYDKVVITPGAEQAKRYDLSKQISRVVYSPTTETLNAFDNSGKSVLMKSGITPERVEDYIGKEPAKRLLDPQNTKSYLRGGKEDSYHEITGEDLRVGGEGMKGFYDQILPSYLNDYGKRYGAQVGTYNLPDPNVHHIPTMADIQRGGMEMFGRADLTPEETLQVENAFRAQRSAETAIPLHSFDITPQMREEITTKGVPLYQAAPPVAIGAGAMQEERPAEYGKGGSVKNVMNVAKMLMPKAEQEANLAKFLAESKAPMRLYHGTTATEGGKGEEAIRRFKPSREGSLGSGVYMTPKPEYSNEYAASTAGNVLPVYAQMRNPLILHNLNRGDPATQALIKLGIDPAKAEKMTERLWEDKGNIGKQIQSRAQAQGYDGLMFFRDGDLAEVVSYNPNAIKSAIGNEGTYDINNPDMNKAGGGAVRKALKAVLPKGQQDILSASESAANLERFLSKSQTSKPVFHVAKTDVKQFSPQHRTELSSMGHHFGTSDQANFRSGQYDFNSQSPNIGKYHLSIQNPLEVSHMASFAPDHLADNMMELNLLKPEKYDALVGKHDYNPLKIGDDLVKILKKNGYDGLKYPNEREGEGFSYVPFDATQIKSAIGNRGTYDPAEADINKAGGGIIKKAAKALLPKGQQAILPAAESAANLKKFLADSAIKDRLYHATPKSFSEFIPGGDNPLRSGPAVWMTPNKFEQPAAHNIRVIPDKPGYMYGNQSGKFTPGTNVMPLHSSIKNPLYSSEATWKQDFEKFGGSPWTLEPSNIQSMKSAGFDGIVYRDRHGDIAEVVAFEPTQVKSAIGNRGTYDITDPDINKANGGQVSNDAMWIALQNKQMRKKHGN